MSDFVSLWPVSSIILFLCSVFAISNPYVSRLLYFFSTSLYFPLSACTLLSSALSDSLFSSVYGYRLLALGVCQACVLLSLPSFLPIFLADNFFRCYSFAGAFTFLFLFLDEVVPLDAASGGLMTAFVNLPMPLAAFFWHCLSLLFLSVSLGVIPCLPVLVVVYAYLLSCLAASASPRPCFSPAGVCLNCFQPPAIRGSRTS